MARLITQFIPDKTQETAEINFDDDNRQNEVRVKTLPGTKILIGNKEIYIGDEGIYNCKDEISSLTIGNWEKIKDINGFYFVANFYKDVEITPDPEEETTTTPSESADSGSTTDQTQSDSGTEMTTASNTKKPNNHDGPNFVLHREIVDNSVIPPSTDSITLPSNPNFITVTILEN